MVDSLIRLFPSTATSFETNGIGVLSDTIDCKVYEERNGSFELEMEYPITGRYYEELSLRKIIVAKSNPYSDPQAFRIFQISRPIAGVVIVNAQHISYDLIGYPLKNFTANSAQESFEKLKSESIVDHPFLFSTNINSSSEFKIESPTGTRNILGGVEDSLLDVYGGEYEFDNFHVILHAARGSNRGVYIRYGKNLTDLEQEENCAEVYTGVYPFWYSEEDGLIELSGQKYVEAEGTYDFTRILVLDLSDQFLEVPTEEELRTEAENYIKNNEIGVPKVSLTVSFVQLADSEEYKHFAMLEEVRLCDTVNVEFLELNVSATAKCISTSYNVLTDKYDSIELGDAKSNLASTIAETMGVANTANANATKENPQTVENIEKTSKKVTGQLGGNILIQDSSGNNQPDELLIMDTKSISTAKKIWKWDGQGLSYSTTGYNGPYTPVDNNDLIGDSTMEVVTNVSLINGELNITKKMIHVRNGRIVSIT